MNSSELKQLIREEIRKTLKEVAYTPDYLTIDQMLNSVTKAKMAFIRWAKKEAASKGLSISFDVKDPAAIANTIEQLTTNGIFKASSVEELESMLEPDVLAGLMMFAAQIDVNKSNIKAAEKQTQRNNIQSMIKSVAERVAKDQKLRDMYKNLPPYRDGKDNSKRTKQLNAIVPYLKSQLKTADEMKYFKEISQEIRTILQK